MSSPVLAAADYVQARAAAQAASGPTNEKGTSLLEKRPNVIIPNMGSGMTWRSLREAVEDSLEHVPELKWKPGGKGAVSKYHLMRTDAQVQGMYLGLTLPIRRYNFYIIPNGADDKLVKRIARNYNLPIQGQEDKPKGRSKRRFSFKNHMRQALLAMLYGHMYFEQYGEIINGEWVIRKLGPRMPASIIEIGAESDGGLSYIVQKGMGATPVGRKRTIPVNRLVAYIWEQEGANWAGRSMLRGITKNFDLKDVVLRVGAINIERAGGVPVITGPKGATPEDLAELGKMARQFRVGANAGGAIPNGAELNLARAAGGEEAVNYIKLQNEEMSRGLLMMFLNLGQATTGSYALGSSLIDYALNSQEVVADWFCDVFNEHVIEDDVDWNEGEQTEQVPLLGYKRTDDKQLALADLAKLVDKNIVTVDDELETWLREEYKMPRRDLATARPAPGAGSPLSESDGQPDEDMADAIEEVAAARAAERVRRSAPEKEVNDD